MIDGPGSWPMTRESDSRASNQGRDRRHGYMANAEVPLALTPNSMFGSPQPGNQLERLQQDPIQPTSASPRHIAPSFGQDKRPAMGNAAYPMTMPSQPATNEAVQLSHPAPQVRSQRRREEHGAPQRTQANNGRLVQDNQWNPNDGSSYGNNDLSHAYQNWPSYPTYGGYSTDGWTSSHNIGFLETSSHMSLIDPLHGPKPSAQASVHSNGLLTPDWQPIRPKESPDMPSQDQTLSNVSPPPTIFPYMAETPEHKRSVVGFNESRPLPRQLLPIVPRPHEQERFEAAVTRRSPRATPARKRANPGKRNKRPFSDHEKAIIAVKRKYKLVCGPCRYAKRRVRTTSLCSRSNWQFTGHIV